MGISPATIAFLRSQGHDAVHLHEENLDRLPDADILAKALAEGRVVLTNDLGFGELVAASGARLPSVITFRLRNMHPGRVNMHLQMVIEHHGKALLGGAAAAVNEGRVRVRSLPLHE
jgi:predicted nuclease of predicted toxin-antitoxin system